MPQTLVEETILEADNSSSLAGGAFLHGPRLPHFADRSFPQIFEDQARRDAAKPAILCGDNQLSFGDLNERANQLARHLRSLGLGRESLVGMCLDRSLEMAVAVLGILKAGAAYLPLDPDYPWERLGFMIEDARPSALVTKSTLLDRITPAKSGAVLIDNDWPTISALPKTNLDDPPQPGDLAYVIYTSGSTGKPKGVMIEHGGLANYLLALNRELELRADDRYLHMASIAFSSSRRQLMLPLSQGATVVIASSRERKDPLALFQMIKQRGVTVMDAVPSFWRSSTTILKELDSDARRELLDNKLRLMLSASEPLRPDIPRTWTIDFSHPAQHVHMFGQTETAGIVCVNPIKIESGTANVNPIPIGYPIANTEILVLDEEMRPCPAGISGELYIGGAGVGRGYLKRPELTTQKFIPHPFSRTSGTRLYRTGDWVKLSEDGRLEFAGRHDQQIKLRGFRVEMGEVEAALAMHPSISETVVIARDHNDSNPRLVAYFVAADGTPNTTELRQFLGKHLPDYAVPSAFVQLEAFPLSANGKIDRLALSKMDEPSAPRTNEYVAPRTPTEKQLASTFRELLQIDQIGVDDNFFDLGGNSLLAGQTIARVRRLFRVEAPITWLFDSPTVGELASRIDAATAKGDLIHAESIPLLSREQSLPLSFSQQRLWFLDQLDPGNHAYNLAHAFEINGELHPEVLRAALNAIVTRHEILRTRFVSVDGTPRQQIDLPPEIDWQLIDLRNSPAAQRADEARRLLEAGLHKPFDLANGPLIRSTLLRLEEDLHLFSLTMHHIVSDGWSTGIFVHELEAFFQDYAAGRISSVPLLTVQYADFAHWQQRRMEAGELDPQIDYWKRQLADAPPVLALPTDHPRSASDSYLGAKTTIRLSSSRAAQLRQLSRSQDATLFMTLLSAFYLLLARYSGPSDVVIGSPVAGRNRVEIEPLIGFFVNTLPLRVNVSPDKTVRELLAQVRQTALETYTNQEVPFEKLVSELQRDRNAEHHPIFQVMFVLQEGARPVPEIDGLTFKSVELQSSTAKFDLGLEAIDDGAGLNLSIEYSTELFADQSIASMLSDLELILDAFVTNPGQRLSEVPSLKWKPAHTPEQTNENGVAATAAFVSPRTPIEERLASIWSEVLMLQRVGVEDNFFALGGHSLMATQVIARVRSAFNYELPLRRLFETPTIAGLADAICESQIGKTEDEEFAALLAELDGLSDDEAVTRLDQEQAGLPA